MNQFSWEFVSSGWSYILLRSAHLLSIPVLMVGAWRDLLIPPVLLRRLTQVNQSDHKMLEIVKNVHYGFDTEWEKSRLTENSARWLVQTGLIEAVKKPLTELSNPDKLI